MLPSVLGIVGRVTQKDKKDGFLLDVVQRETASRPIRQDTKRLAQTRAEAQAVGRVPTCGL